jgi:hypothetical protein
MKKVEKKSKMIQLSLLSKWRNFTVPVFVVFTIIIVSCNNATQEKSRRLKDCLIADSIYRASLDNDLNTNTNTPADKKFIKTANVKFKTTNVRKATEKIEDLTAFYKGYVTYSNLTNHVEQRSQNRISKDSILISNLITVNNEITLKVPANNLDSLLRALNPLITLLDFRIYKLDEVTFKSLLNQKKSERFSKYEHRQTKNIDTKQAKLKETSNAEDNLLEKQMQADAAQIANLELENDIKYCTLTIYLYQDPLITREAYEDFDNLGFHKHSLWKRIYDSLCIGWRIFEEIIVFIFKLWGIIFIITASIVLYRNISSIKKLFKKAQIRKS